MAGCGGLNSSGSAGIGRSGLTFASDFSCGNATRREIEAECDCPACTVLGPLVRNPGTAVEEKLQSIKREDYQHKKTGEEC
jgi:hypothetical protein